MHLAIEMSHKNKLKTLIPLRDIKGFLANNIAIVLISVSVCDDCFVWLSCIIMMYVICLRSVL